MFEQELEADSSSVGADLGLGRAYYALGQYARARNESYDDERPDFSTDPELLKVRNDDDWNSGDGLVWGFGSGWSVRKSF